MLAWMSEFADSAESGDGDNRFAGVPVALQEEPHFWIAAHAIGFGRVGKPGRYVDCPSVWFDEGEEWRVEWHAFGCDGCEFRIERRGQDVGHLLGEFWERPLGE